jgi:hypothetical protein
MKGHMVRSTIFLSVYIQFTHTMPSGYLPPEKWIWDWMLSHKYHDKEETTEWLYGFLHTLLCVTFGEVEAPHSNQGLSDTPCMSNSRMPLSIDISSLSPHDRDGVAPVWKDQDKWASYIIFLRMSSQWLRRYVPSTFFHHVCYLTSQISNGKLP